jgi:hypothetical protein
MHLAASCGVAGGLNLLTYCFNRIHPSYSNVPLTKTWPPATIFRPLA